MKTHTVPKAREKFCRPLRDERAANSRTKRLLGLPARGLRRRCTDVSHMSFMLPNVH